MKRTNAPPIPEGIRIKLSGEQEWKDVMQVFEDQGWMRLNGDKPTDSTNYYKNTLPIIITKSDKKIARGSTIRSDQLTATEFLQQYQGTIEYEVGDWVVILVDQSGDPEGTVTQVVHVDGNSVYAKNISRSGTSITNWSATVDSIRPATPEEIPYDTKVASKDPDVYIWDGDVLPDEYVIQNPTPNKDNQELAELLNIATGNKQGWRGNAIYGYLINKEGSKPTYAIDSVGIPIVPYELWKSILEQPDPLAEPVAIKPRYHIDNVMDQDIAISCPTIELWNAVTGLIPNNNRLTEENWKDYNSNDEIAGCNINQFGGNHCDIDWYKDEKYTIITAEEFLRDNGVAVPQPKWSIVTTDGVRVYEGDKAWWLYQDGKKWFGDETNEGDILTKGSVVDHIVLGYKAFSTFEAAEKYRQEQLGSSSTVKENIVPIGWKPGDSWRHKDGTCGLSISVHPKDGDPNMYFIDYAENATAWVEVNVINEFVAKGLWIINPDQKSKQEEKSQTIINKQSKTKQNEKGNSISITEQCIVINSNYINCKTSNATYVPGDEERITKGQRRQGSTVRG